MSYLTLVVLATLLAFAAGLSSRQANGGEVVYRQFHIDSEIVARYSTTTIKGVIFNRANSSQELSFQVQLPETAFISNFSMTVNGRTYYGRAEEKARAAEEFEVRQGAGENVGLVESRGTDLFAIRINTAADSEAIFMLQYEELITRQLSRYSQTLSLNPGSVVEDFHVRVRAVEEQGISTMEASDYVSVERVSDNEVMFSYFPSMEEQNDTVYGLARDMSIGYDVIHPPSGAGSIVVNDCYFAQFFSPSGVEAVPVDLVFVIDVSGSMRGRKIEQTREALESILNDLRPRDRFSMVTFESGIEYWMQSLVSASEYRQQGIQFARSLQAGGGTNFNDGLLAGATILKDHANPDYIQLLVMLTDGQPTVGVIDTEAILSNAHTALLGTRISLNCLGFGFNLNFDLLEKLALANNGIVRRIYEDSDANLQLEGFFEEISSPILRDIRVIYPDGAIDVVSDTEFPLLFNGSELVIAGRFVCNGSQSLRVQITGTGVSGQITFESQVDTDTDTEIAGLLPSTERLSAYLFIKQLLDERTIADSGEAAAAFEQEALVLALRYNFVTELTSLIVVEDVRSGTDGSGFGLGEGGGGRAEDDGDVFNRPGVPTAAPAPAPASPHFGFGLPVVPLSLPPPAQPPAPASPTSTTLPTLPTLPTSPASSPPVAPSDDTTPASPTLPTLPASPASLPPVAPSDNVDDTAPAPATSTTPPVAPSDNVDAGGVGAGVMLTATTLLLFLLLGIQFLI